MGKDNFPSASGHLRNCLTRNCWPSFFQQLPVLEGKLVVWIHICRKKKKPTTTPNQNKTEKCNQKVCRTRVQGMAALLAATENLYWQQIEPLSRIVPWGITSQTLTELRG